MSVDSITFGRSSASYGIDTSSARVERTGTPAQAEATAAASQAAGPDAGPAAVFEKSGGMGAEERAELVDRLKAEVQARTDSLRSLVEKMISKQAGTSVAAFSTDDFWEALKSGNLQVDAATRAEAQAAIADDGYWGVEQTSDRIVKFASALAGGDPDKLEKMMDAFEKGYEAAEKQWGSALPDISQRTRDAVRSKFEDLRQQYAAGTGVEK